MNHDERDEHDDEDGRSGRRAWIVRALFLVAICALGWTIHHLGWRDVVRRLAAIGPWFAVVLAIDIAMTLVDSIAIHAFLGANGRRHGFGATVTAQIIGRATNAISPIGGLGSVVKVMMLAGSGKKTLPVAAVLQVNLVGFWLEVMIVAIGVPIAVAMLDLPDQLEIALDVGAAIAGAIAIALPLLARRGLLASLFAGLFKLHIVSARTVRRMKRELGKVDKQIKPARRGARRRDQVIGAVAVVVSHLGSWAIKCTLVYAAGGPTALGFFAALIALGQMIYWISRLVPMGLGVTEGGNYAVFSLLGADPATGVTISLAARVIDLAYAVLGAVLIVVSPSVRELRQRARRG